jgi:hypothetical protein
VLQPTRAIPRKNIAAGIALAEALDAVYWLTGAAEDGYGPQLGELLNRARCPVRRGLPGGLRMADAYAAADAVVLPSTWEGFGIPLIESALASRPLAVNGYPVAQEVAALSFIWFPTDDPAPLAAWFADPDPALLARNRALARHHFGPDALARRLTETLARAGPHPRSTPYSTDMKRGGPPVLRRPPLRHRTQTRSREENNDSLRCRPPRAQGRATARLGVHRARDHRAADPVANSN